MDNNSIIKDFCLNRENLNEYSQALDDMFTNYVTTEQWCELTKDRRVNMVNMVNELKTLIVSIKKNEAHRLSMSNNVTSSHEEQVA